MGAFLWMKKRFFLGNIDSVKNLSFELVKNNAPLFSSSFFLWIINVMNVNEVIKIVENCTDTSRIIIKYYIRKRFYEKGRTIKISLFFTDGG